MKKYWHIAVLGNIASGKTTLSQSLAKGLKADFIDADLFDKNPFIELYATDHARYAFITELFFTHCRIKKQKEILISLKTNNTVVDSGLLMSIWVYAKNHLHQKTMTKDEWEFYKKIAGELQIKSSVREDLAIFLDAAPQTCLKRIAERGRDFEKAHTLAYLTNLDDRLKELKENLRKEGKIKILSFDTEKDDIRGKRGLLKITMEVQKVLNG